ncbi:sensor histidine kinase [Kyrpidia spormannii]|uniref:histidine kinase n=1 Tax=Kyrpidia spormannii TaxID=2055160 RepID=A0A2K8N5F2_9BACL|nr:MULTISPECIES: histidine kinase [Kyrpidia]ATY84315.1 sensor histidine kinase [Kyrpidia spormannii]MCL6575583.1 histidine kinase [Kyrpidia sp.]CAB3391827.1 Sensor protein LytS [Kyrpidia spormannii]
MGLTFSLLSRTSLLLVAGFLVSRTPAFRRLLERRWSPFGYTAHALLFAVLAVAGVEGGILLHGGRVTEHGWIWHLGPDQELLGPGLVAVVIAGLLGGIRVGGLSGLLVALFVAQIGGWAHGADVMLYPLAGVLSGMTARFFSDERVIAPEKAFFIGMFFPVLHMALLLIWRPGPETIQLVSDVGLPLTLTNSVAIGVFTAIVRVAVHEYEQGAALQTEKALRVAEQTLPQLRRGLSYDTAEVIARFLLHELDVAAVSLTDREKVLAHEGLGRDHHGPGTGIRTEAGSAALRTGTIQVAPNRAALGCSQPSCPLAAAIMVPLRRSGETIGLVNLMFRHPQQLRAADIALAEGLGRLISHQLDAIFAEEMRELLRQSQLRHLQAQIEPHFLFNTLNLIGGLIRVNPPLARHIVVQLGNFVRMNLRAARYPLIPLAQELQHLRAYLEIVKARFADQLTVFLDVDESLVDGVQIPPLTLQPLVENAVKHGVRSRAVRGRVGVFVRAEGGDLVIEVQDNGTGVDPVLLPRLGVMPIEREDGTGGGLYNVNQRLIGLLGPGAALQFDQALEGGLRVRFRLPRIAQGNGAEAGEGRPSSAESSADQILEARG